MLFNLLIILGMIVGKSFLLFLLTLKQVVHFLNAKCSHTYRMDSGTIYSPEYPNKYPDNYHCEYLIDGSIFHMMKLEFLEFAVEDIMPNCHKDYVEIYTGYFCN